MARQLYLRAIERHFARPRIEHERTASQLRTTLSIRTANQRAQARQQLLHAKRLRHVVVGAAVDSLHLLVPASARGQHEHGHRLAGFAPAAEQRQAIDLRQAEVEHDGVVAFVVAEQIGAFAVGGVIDGVACASERGGSAASPATVHLPRRARAHVAPSSSFCSIQLVYRTGLDRTGLDQLSLDPL